MIDIIFGVIIGCLFCLFVIIYICCFLSPIFIFYMSLKLNKLTKFGVLIYFNLIFVCLNTYLPLFNEKIFENVELSFQIICGISYLIFLIVLVIPEKYSPKIYIEDKAEK